MNFHCLRKRKSKIVEIINIVMKGIGIAMELAVEVQSIAGEFDALREKLKPRR